jgi:hypothetical protein
MGIRDPASGMGSNELPDLSNSEVEKRQSMIVIVIVATGILHPPIIPIYAIANQENSQGTRNPRMTMTMMIMSLFLDPKVVVDSRQRSTRSKKM